ncbi:MAG: hypothetical protein AAF907_08805 [Planctomycetota bacterium]
MTAVTLTDDAFAELSRIAADRGMTVEQWLNATYGPPQPDPTPPPPPGESAYDAWMKIGAIGCIKGGPDDVATNPKYMEDFGKS